VQPLPVIVGDCACCFDSLDHPDEGVQLAERQVRLRQGVQLLEERDDVGDGPDFVRWQFLPECHRVSVGSYRLPQVKGAYGGHALGRQPAGDLNLTRCSGRLAGLSDAHHNPSRQTPYGVLGKPYRFGVRRVEAGGEARRL
jgi:hypothetical protein